MNFQKQVLGVGQAPLDLLNHTVPLDWLAALVWIWWPVGLENYSTGSDLFFFIPKCQCQFLAAQLTWVRLPSHSGSPRTSEYHPGFLFPFWLSFLISHKHITILFGFRIHISFFFNRPNVKQGNGWEKKKILVFFFTRSARSAPQRNTWLMMEVVNSAHRGFIIL